MNLIFLKFAELDALYGYQIPMHVPHPCIVVAETGCVHLSKLSQAWFCFLPGPNPNLTYLLQGFKNPRPNPNLTYLLPRI